MTWAILLAIIVVVVIVSVSGRQRVPWANKLHRMNPGVASKAEWIAPQNVRQCVYEDYTAAIKWMHENMLDDWTQQWSDAPLYLTGRALHRHQEILKRYRMGRLPRYVGVMRCTHQVEVRHFSEDGERCVVVDYQVGRRVATYDRQENTRVMTQDLGDGAVVYEMHFDKQTKRWQIATFIQELPSGWSRRNRTKEIQLLATLPPANGRDD